MAPSEILGIVYGALMAVSVITWIGFNVRKS